jgi:prepilin-type N-terminal cleavage/methylation domain-containing protein
VRQRVSGVRCQVSGIGAMVANARPQTARLPGPRHPTPDSRHLTSRSGFTLIELLVAITIIGILAGLILGVASVAGETARHRQTEQIIARLHTLLMEHYDTYKTRRVALRQQVIDGINDPKNRWSGAQKGRALAEARLYALRELMLMEVPDRWSDILLRGVPATNAANVAPWYPIYLDVSGSSNGRTELTSAYLRRYFQYARNANTEEEVESLTDNQGAECLYLIITLATGDGEARGLFGENTIGDTDGDGAKEFLDGWDRPINFLRWAPGFDSQIQINANQFLPLPISSAWHTAADNDHDPFDVFRVDRPAFRLVPLIFSAGGDETFGIRLVKPHLTWPGIEKVRTPFTSNAPKLIPYQLVQDENDDVFLGTDSGEGAATDNIHNHLLGDR